MPTAKQNKPDRPDRPNRPERLDRPDRPKRPEKPDRPDRQFSLGWNPLLHFFRPDKSGGYRVITSCGALIGGPQVSRGLLSAGLIL